MTDVTVETRLPAALDTTLDSTITARLREVAARHPAAPAIVSAGGVVDLTHRELITRATRLAHELVTRGVTPGSLVAIAPGSAADEVVAALGVLFAGAAVVPLDRAWPAERLRTVLADCRPVLVIAEPGLEVGPALALSTLPALRDPRASEAPVVELAPGSPAYVIYTSGTTGRPKGVVVPHGALAHLVRARLEIYADVPPERLLPLVPLTFDPWLGAVAWTLAAGGALVLPGAAVRRDPAAAAALIAATGATHLVAAASLHAALLEAAAAGQLGSLRATVVGGEAMTPSLVERHRARAPGARLWNEYGPTEATVCTTVHEVPLEGPVPQRVPIGRPIGAARCLVVGADGREVPPGEPGELWIGGPGLALGYLNQPERTQERFARHPFVHGSEARVYRTGDRVRRLADGALEFLGRLDGQVKVRGERIELGEVEAALLRHPGVRAAAVTLHADAPGGPTLVGYAVARDGDAPTPLALRRALAATLPRAAVPSAFVLLPDLPRGETGKVERAALPAPGPEHLARESAADPPRTDEERRLAALWSDLLRVPGIHRGDDFFLLGGHSLLAARCVAEVAEAFHVELELRDLFAAPTLAGFAARIAAARVAPAPAPPPSPAPPPRPSPPPSPGLVARLRGALGGLERRARFHGLAPGLPGKGSPYLTPSQADAAAQVMTWAAEYIGRTHPELGRKGPICPFVPAAIKQGALQVAVVDDLGPDSSPAALDRALLDHVSDFRRRFPVRPDERLKPLASVVLVFPHLTGDAAAAVDGCHARTKYFLMPRGIMLSQFHPACEKPGVHNQAFALYKAPLPCIVVRHMGVHDIVFVDRHREAFLEFRRRFGRDFARGDIGDDHGYETRYREACARFGLTSTR